MNFRNILTLLVLVAASWILATDAHATTEDRDGDGFSNDAEVQIYGTDPDNPSSHPGSGNPGAIDFTKLSGPERIEVDLSSQRLQYYVGTTLVGDIGISSGVARMPTPKGTFAVRSKIPTKTYAGRGYYYPNTKWNMSFLPGFYIHGAYWHNDFGIRPRSHGCVNVAYRDMPQLYAFADVGTRVMIRQ